LNFWWSRGGSNP